MRHQSMADRIEPLYVGDGHLVTAALVGGGRCSRGWQSGGGQRMPIGFADLFHRRHIDAARDRRDRLVGCQQGLERRRGVRIDPAAVLLELLDVAADQHAPCAGVDVLVDHRDNAATQAVAGRLGRKVRAVDRIAAGQAHWDRQQRTDDLQHADGAGEPRRTADEGIATLIV